MKNKDICVIFPQGLKVEPLEDNMFEWKCSIKATVSYTVLKRSY